MYSKLVPILFLAVKRLHSIQASRCFFKKQTKRINYLDVCRDDRFRSQSSNWWRICDFCFVQSQINCGSNTLPVGFSPCLKHRYRPHNSRSTAIHTRVNTGVPGLSLAQNQLVLANIDSRWNGLNLCRGNLLWGFIGPLQSVEYVQLHFTEVAQNAICQKFR